MLTYDQLMNKRSALIAISNLYLDALNVTTDKEERKELWKYYGEVAQELLDTEKQMIQN